MLGRTDVEGRRAIRVGERVEPRPFAAVRRIGQIAVSRRRGLSRDEKESATPTRIAPGVRHHGAVPFRKDPAVAGGAFAGIVGFLEVALEGRRYVVGLGGDIGSRAGNTVRKLVLGTRRSIGQCDQSAGGRESDQGIQDQGSIRNGKSHGIPRFLCIPRLTKEIMLDTTITGS
jgi:hypothetical protein